ncbi:hypothetical protein [Persicimonas caeni]|uniref:hypothetical protein n=1 Tax=Persicimonas caeni TaxID=2292766 RepID=UPI00143D519D|nr:hypothetical protein [Persicimonas caeni]
MNASASANIFADSPLAQLRRHGLVHVGIRRNDGDETLLVGVPSEVCAKLRAS